MGRNLLLSQWMVLVSGVILVSLAADRVPRYPYPLFEVLTPAWRGTLFAGSALIMTLSAILLKILYERVNGRRLAAPSASISASHLKH